MLRLYLLTLAILLISTAGCLLAPGGVAPPELIGYEAPPSPDMRIGLDEALRFAEPPIYLIAGRDLLPDGTAASWIILSADPEGGYLVLFVTAEGAVPARWEGPAPGQPVNPEAFPFPAHPADQVVFSEGQG